MISSTSQGSIASLNSYPSYSQTYESLLAKYRAKKPSASTKGIEAHFKEKNILLIEQLANGPNSVVYLGKQLGSDKLYAIKLLLKSGIEQLGGGVLRRRLDYAKIHASSSIAILHEFASISEGCLSLVTDYYPKGSLAKHLETNGCLVESQAQKVFDGVLQGLSHLHSCKLAHRNLKLENVLLDQQMKAVVVDFCFTLVVTNNTNHEDVLSTSLPYLAPEVLSGIPYDPIPADIFSFGVCLFTALNDCLPFGTSGRPSKPNSTSCNLKPQVEMALSADAKKVIKDSLQFDVNKRASAPFLQNEQWFRK